MSTVPLQSRRVAPGIELPMPTTRPPRTMRSPRTISGGSRDTTTVAPHSASVADADADADADAAPSPSAVIAAPR